MKFITCVLVNSNPTLLNITHYIHKSLLAPVVVCIMKFNYMISKASLNNVNNQRGPLPPPPPPPPPPQWGRHYMHADPLRGHVSMHEVQ